MSIPRFHIWIKFLAVFLAIATIYIILLQFKLASSVAEDKQLNIALPLRSKTGGRDCALLNVLANQTEVKWMTAVNNSSFKTDPKTSLAVMRCMGSRIIEEECLDCTTLPHYTWLDVDNNLAIVRAYLDLREKVVAIIGSALLVRSYVYVCDLYYLEEDEVYTVALLFITRYLYYCPLPKSNEISGAKPNYVIIRHAGIDISKREHVGIPIKHIKKRTPKKTLAVCGPTVFRFLQDWPLVLQFFELYKVLGVERFTVYMKQAGPTVQKVLDYYYSSNQLDLVIWGSSPKCTELSNYYCQWSRINDCVYRSMYNYRYVAIVDFDEILYPAKRYKTLVDLLKALDFHNIEDPNVGSFLFRSVLVHRTQDIPDWPKKQDQISIDWLNQIIPFSSNFTRSDPPAPEFFKSKAVIKPEAVKLMWVHYVHKYMPGYDVKRVPITTGLNRHQKIVTDSESYGPGNGSAILSWIDDEPKQTHQQKLLSNVMDTIQAINK